MPSLPRLQNQHPSSSSSSGVQAEMRTVTVPLEGDVAEAAARAVLIQLGLINDVQLAGFHRRFGADYLKLSTAALRKQQSFTARVDAARRQKLSTLTITVDVPADVIAEVQRHLFGSATPTSGKPLTRMTSAEKIGEAVKRSLPLLPADVRDDVAAMLTPEALATMAGVLTVWAVSHFFGVGEIADIVLLVVGVAALGGVALKAAEELTNFAGKAINARREQDLNQAAVHFSNAVALIGVQAVMVILFKSKPKALHKTPINPRTGEAIKPLAVKTMPAAPRTPGKVFYRPKTTRYPSDFPGEGMTSMYGDIVYSAAGSLDVQRMVLIHERVHSLLTPKLNFLRNVRVALKTNSYLKSHLLRYLEEALAETIARVGVNGYREAVVGVTFPIKYGYVTLAEMGRESVGIVLGPVNVGGIAFKAVYTDYTPSKSGWKEAKTVR